MVPVDWREAVCSGRCPVCFFLRQDEFAELSHWVGGNVADPQNRLRLEEAGGFCNGHFWQLNQFHSPQSGSLVNAFIAARLLQSLRNPAGDDGQTQATWLREAATRCPVCVHLRVREAAHVRNFLGWLADAQAWAKYEASQGLCLPHSLRCLGLVQDLALRDRLSKAQAVQIKRLQNGMGALVQKLAAGRRWDVSRDEWAAWERTTEKLVGRSGVSPS